MVRDPRAGGRRRAPTPAITALVDLPLIWCPFGARLVQMWRDNVSEVPAKCKCVVHDKYAALHAPVAVGG